MLDIRPLLVHVSVSNDGTEDRPREVILLFPLHVIVFKLAQFDTLRLVSAVL
jgi:hypothetical protein